MVMDRMTIMFYGGPDGSLAQSIATSIQGAIGQTMQAPGLFHSRFTIDCVLIELCLWMLDRHFFSKAHHVPWPQ